MADRREFLATLAAAGTFGLAGCTDYTSGSNYSPGTDENTEWPMPAYDRGFSGFNPDAAAPRDGVTERWSIELAGLGPSARPVVTGERVLVATAGSLVALDLSTGEKRWRHGQEQPWPSAPAVHDGIAYTGFADQSSLVALDVKTGEEQWRIETRGSIKATPTFDHRYKNLYIGDDMGRIYRIDVANGAVTLRGTVFGPVTALAHGHSLLVGTESGEVYNVYSHEGEFTGLWRRKVDGSVTALTASSAGAIVGTFGGSLYHMRDGAHVGSSLWESEKGAMYIAATDEDVLGSDGGGIRALDSRSGTVDWDREGRYGASPAIAGDTVYIGGGRKGENGSGFVEALALSGGTGVDPVTFGGRRWRFDVESAVMEGVAVADGAVFAATQSLPDSPSRVFALDSV